MNLVIKNRATVVCEAGSKVTVSEIQGKLLISLGLADEVKPEKKKDKE